MSLRKPKLPCSKSPLQIKLPSAPTDCTLPVRLQPPAQHATAAAPPEQKKPTGHAAHAAALVAPAGAVDPGAHGVHADAPSAAHVPAGHSTHAPPARYAPPKQPAESATPVADVKTPTRPPGLGAKLWSTHVNTFAPWTKPLATVKGCHTLNGMLLSGGADKLATGAPLRYAVHALSHAHFPLTDATPASTTRKLVDMSV